MRLLANPSPIVIKSFTRGCIIPLKIKIIMMKYILYLLLFYSIFFNYGCTTSRESQKVKLPERGELKAPGQAEATGLVSYNVKVELGELSVNDDLRNSANKFYGNRDFHLAWFGYDQSLQNRKDLIQAIDNASAEGMDPKIYGYTKLKQLEQKIEGIDDKDLVTPEIYKEADLFFTLAYIKFLEDMYYGMVRPTNVESTWEVMDKPALRTHVILENALTSNKISESIKDQRPKEQQYIALKDKLKELKIARDKGGWDLPTQTGVYEEGDTSRKVVQIKKYLFQVGDLKGFDPSNYTYDENLTKAVERFQERHGLKTDGIVGGQTYEEMRKSIDERIKTIKINLEREKWQDRQDRDEYICVNLPSYLLHYYKDGSEKLKSKVIIGEIEHYTPVLKDTLEYIVFSPRWNVPRSIFIDELLPKILEDPNFLDKNNFAVYQGRDKADIDLARLDSTEVKARYLRLVQESGPGNALGSMKFIFPNNRSIYLHDTPTKYLFDTPQRTYSHGCVRVARPVELALDLLENNDEVTWENINELRTLEKPKRIYLDRKVLVKFLYQTAFVDDNGKLNFREDIYGIDKQQELVQFNQDRLSRSLAMIK